MPTREQDDLNARTAKRARTSGGKKRSDVRDAPGGKPLRVRTSGGEVDDPVAAKRLSATEMLPLVYADLRALAAQRLKSERRNHTLQPTALVHEVFIKLQARSEPGYLDRTHFLATAARAMRQILVDHARARGAQKRGGAKHRVSLSGASMVFVDDRIEDVLAVDRALTKLAEYDPRLAQVVEMRFFGGLREVEIAAELEYSERWVRKQWEFARAWLLRELDRS